jgi:HPt (histidine-containing phosphotransfer) domain-containing protein
MNDTPLDPAVMAEFRETMGDDFAAELVDTFLSEAPTLLDDLRAALETDDVDRFRRAAHSIKSNANVFGAPMLAEQARSLELGGMDGPNDALTSHVQALDDEFARVAAALRTLLNG